MWTGRETLGSIESTIAKLHREEGQLDAALRSAVGDSERLHKERAEALRELARVKLDEMAAGRLVENLDAGERRANQLLDEYRGRIAAISERREGLLKEVAKAQTERDAAAGVIESALDAVEAIRAGAEGKVKALAAWQEAKAANDAADAVATEAEKKAALSEADLGAKRKPYDDDPLFLYLWRRGFGTGRYNAGGFTRYMDRMVADFIGFGDVHKRAHIYRAILEGLAYGLREGKERVEKRGGVRMHRVRVSGGGSQSDLAMQITADVFGVPAERPHTFETSALGAAMCTAVGLGVHKDFPTAVRRMTRVGKVFHPVPSSVRTYDALYKRLIQRVTLSDVSSSFAMETIKYTTAIPVSYAK